MVRFVLPLVLGLGLAACGGRSVPHPRYVPQPTSALVEVPYPPPPAHVEMVPDQPDGDAVWVDGEWTWSGRRWAWRPGRWSTVVEGVAFSPWTMVRRGDGATFVAPGAWRNAQGDIVPDPPVVEVGQLARGSVVSAEGEIERTGVSRVRDGGREGGSW